MDALIQFCDNIIKLDIDELLAEIYDRSEFKELVAKLNLQDQLFAKGINSKGVSLGEYAESTKKKKRKDGLPDDRITLFQSGNFYDTIEIIPDNDGFWIVMDGRKRNTDLFVRYGEDVLGLTDENFEPLKDLINEELVKLIQEKITDIR